MGILTDIATGGESKVLSDLTKRSNSSGDDSDSGSSDRLKPVSEDEYLDDPGVASGYRRKRSTKRQ